jgi:hypothetical protein
MYLKKNFPFLVGVFVITVGLLFCVSSLIEGALLDPKPPGSHFLLGISLLFIGIGIYSIYLLRQGKLKKSGKSITEVRQESVKKLKDPALLAQIVSEDQNSEIRKAAENRLEELNR